MRTGVLWLAVFVLVGATVGVRATASAQYESPRCGPGGDARGYDTLRCGHPAMWSGYDEDWYRTNRKFALAGKIMTVVGVIGIFATGFASPHASEGEFLLRALPAIIVQNVGQISWSIAELRAAKRMRARGLHVSKVPGILSVIGAFTFSPIVWVTAPIQSALLRNTQRDPLLPPSGLSSVGGTLRLTF